MGHKAAVEHFLIPLHRASGCEEFSEALIQVFMMADLMKLVFRGGNGFRVRKLKESKRDVTCFSCGQAGHYSAECTRSANNERYGGSNRRESAWMPPTIECSEKCKSNLRPGNNSHA